MKTFDDIRGRGNEEQINERDVRKGAGLVFARQSKVFGDRAAKDFKSALEKFNIDPNATHDEGMKSLSSGLSDMSRGLVTSSVINKKTFEFLCFSCFSINGQKMTSENICTGRKKLQGELPNREDRSIRSPSYTLNLYSLLKW